jgi:hypothetical protein
VSYIRNGHPLTWFKGNSHSYVYLSDAGIVDYDDEYEDLPTFIELIGNIVGRETDDPEFANKIVRTLAVRLKVADQLRQKPLTDQEYLDYILESSKETMRRLNEDK